MIESPRDITSHATPSGHRHRRLDGGRSSSSSSRSGGTTPKTLRTALIHHHRTQSSLESIPEEACQEFFHNENVTTYGYDTKQCKSNNDLHRVNHAPAADKEPERWEEGEEPEENNPYTLVNQERARHQLPALRRNAELDRLALRHCRGMAELRTVFHSVQSIEELVTVLKATQHAAESIQRGDHLLQMHQETVDRQRQSSNYHNLISTVFTEFGAATCPGRDGKLYLCLLFRN